MQRTQVLIVGAGPTGLALAAQLHRSGISIRVIDKHASPLELTKSAALHARTLEHLRDLGVVDRVIAEGQRVDVLALRTGYRDRISVDFRGLADTAYPHMIDIPQNRTEHILIDHLADVGVTLDRRTTLTGMQQSGDGVLATVIGPDGAVDTIAADWLVGCDGVNSTVRSLVGLDFVGEAYADDWVLCDGVVDWPLPRNEMTFSGDTEGIYGVFPLPGERRYRLAYTQSRGADGLLVEPDLADAQRAMARTGIDGTIRSVDQFWTFNLAHKQATGYRRGRVFLVGDAGHVHTPFGGQGLNLGVGDAMNLGWKLAAVTAGRAPAALLDSYEAERHRVARQVVAFTHRGAQAMLLRADPRHHVRDAAMAVLQATPPARRLMAQRLSQLAHSYRGTSAVTGRTGRVRAGDRLPDVAVFDGNGGRAVRLHDLLPSDRHTLLLTGVRPADAPAVRDLVAALTRERPDQLAVQVLTTAWELAAQLPQVPVVLDRGLSAVAISGRRIAAYLIRPDRHIGYAGPPDHGSIQRYLNMVLTFATTTAAAPPHPVAAPDHPAAS